MAQKLRTDWILFTTVVLMVLFGAPLPDPDSADHAMASALEMSAALDELNREWQAQGSQALRFGIGINTGVVVAGVEAVSVAANDVHALSDSISNNNRATSEQTVAAATASSHASANVESVAAATEQLTASIGEIAKQVSRSAEIAGKAAEE